MPFVDKKTVKKIDALVDRADQNSDILMQINNSINNSHSAINKKLDRILKNQVEFNLMAEKITESLARISSSFDDSISKLNNAADVVNDNVKAFSKKSAKTFKAVNDSITESTNAMVDTSEALTRLCAEMIAEYNREIDESIRLLSVESLISNLPK